MMIQRTACNIYDAEKYEHTQDLLHSMFDPEVIELAYTKMNMFRVGRKQTAFEILLAPARIEPEAPVLDIQKDREKNGESCSECGSMDLRFSGNCAVCGQCGSSQGCS